MTRRHSRAGSSVTKCGNIDSAQCGAGCVVAATQAVPHLSHCGTARCPLHARAAYLIHTKLATQGEGGGSYDVGHGWARWV
jgi:hypothetical protein